MNQLVLRDKAHEYVFRFLGGVTLLGVGLQLFTVSPKRAIFWIQAVLFVLVAILFFTQFFGTFINRISADRGILTVRWNTKIFKKHIRIDQIAEITDDRRQIRIIMKDGHTLSLPVKLMDSDKRHKVRRFLKENTGL